jgi:hypothetical protein
VAKEITFGEGLNNFVMEQSGKAKKFSVPALSGQVHVKCPICANEEFLDSGPADESERRGFRHVVVGVSGSNRLAYIPVRFKFCSNCGFIVQFVIHHRGHKDAK